MVVLSKIRKSQIGCTIILTSCLTDTSPAGKLLEVKLESEDIATLNENYACGDLGKRQKSVAV